jgi:UDP-GlcNAc:undecaprenyl-phosphate GlcNAc-1-phosphate transferase
VFLSCAIAYAVAGPPEYGAVAAAAAGIALLGFLDDRIQLKPLVKVAGQVAAAGFVIASGSVFHMTNWPTVNVAISVLWIVGITNAFNLIDNMDGLCGGVIVIISLFRCGFALQNGDLPGAMLSMIIAGGFLGFLFFNYKPSKIFMGDCGSMFGGFALAALTVAAPVPYTKAFLSSLLYPAVTFIYPIFDTILVSILRRAAGRPISVGGRDHSSHRLVSLGHSERKVVLLFWLLTAAGGVTGLFTQWMPVGVHAIGLLLMLGVAIFGVFLATLPAYELPEKAPMRAVSIRKLIPTLRSGVVLIVETSLAGIALLIAFLLRWESAFPTVALRHFLFSLPIVMACHALSCLGFRTFNLGWRWFDVRDTITLGKCVFMGVASSTSVLWLAGMRGHSRAVFLIYSLLILSSSIGVRLTMRFLWHTFRPVSGRRRAAILGADPSAELLVLVLQKEERLDACPVLIVDTDPATDSTRIHGIPVVYAGDAPAKLLRQRNIDRLILPQNRGLSEEQQQVVDACLREGLQVAAFDMTVKPLGPALPATS